MGTTSAGELTGSNIRSRQPGYVPRASEKPPRSLEGDYIRFVDCQRSAADLGACSVRTSSAASSPRGEIVPGNCMLRNSHSHTGLPSRYPDTSYGAGQSRMFLNDVSEGAPELYLGPGGPGLAARSSSSRTQMTSPFVMHREFPPRRSR